jgi:hypothetical protein
VEKAGAQVVLQVQAAVRLVPLAGQLEQLELQQREASLVWERQH